MPFDINSVEWLSHALARMCHNYVKREFERRGLQKVSHPPILFTLKYKAKNKTASQRELAELLGISAPTVAISIKRMERAGLLRKVMDIEDQRRNQITLTQKGEQLTDECESVIHEIGMIMCRGFSSKEKEQLRLFCQRIIANLENEGIPAPACQRKERDE